MMSFPLQVFYDGACLVCSHEMEGYRKRNPENRLAFIDISAVDFDADQYGKTREDFMAQIHARDADGNFYTGVDAFVAIWQAYPSGSFYRLLGVVVGLPGIDLFSRFGYRTFARHRHLLPKRKVECESDRCNLKH